MIAKSGKDVRTESIDVTEAPEIGTMTMIPAKILPGAPGLGINERQVDRSRLGISTAITIALGIATALASSTAAPRITRRVPKRRSTGVVILREVETHRVNPLRVRKLVRGANMKRLVTNHRARREGPGHPHLHKG